MMYGCPFFVYLTLFPPLRAYCFAVPYDFLRDFRLVRLVVLRVDLRCFFLPLVPRRLLGEEERRGALGVVLV